MRSTTFHTLRRVLVLAGLLLGIFLGPAPAVGAEFANPPEFVPASWEPPQLPDDWTTVRSVAFEAHGHRADLDLLNALSEHGSKALPRLAKELGVPLGGTFHVFLTRSQEEFRALQPGAPPTWADGTAYPSIGAIYLRHPDLRGGTARPLEQVLDHELVHVLLGKSFGDVPVPRWLQEGVAQVYAGEAGPDLAGRIARGSVGVPLYGLGALEQGFPADPHRADLAYAQSADFIQWLRVKYGADAVRDMIRFTREGRSLNDAILRITGEPLLDIDARWRDRLVATTPFLGGPENFEGMLWGGAGLAILVVGFSRRRSFMHRMRAWKEEDVALDRIAREMLDRRRKAPRA